MLRVRVRNRSEDKICRSALEVKSWRARMPSTSETRPPRCLGCGAAGRPLGGKLVVHGDGTRERQVRGPATATGHPEIITVHARRFECQRCGACMLVVPKEILPRRLYTASAIALALAVWALLGASEASSRARVSPFAIVGDAAHARWDHVASLGGGRRISATLRDVARRAADVFAAAIRRARVRRARGARSARPHDRAGRFRRRRSSPRVIRIAPGEGSRQP